MSNRDRLAYAIISYLEGQIANDTLSADAVESLEVAKQCLETAYGISLEDVHLDTGRSLLDIFCDATGLQEVSSPGTTIGLTFESSPAALATEIVYEPTDDAAIASVAAAAAAVPDDVRAKAEEIKNDGNNMMKNERFADAVEMYSKAIALDNTNAVYYSNRAAGNNKLKNFQKAIEDCQKAISLDPNYSKAYGRMGLAYSGLNDFSKAKEAYQKACELDPSNDSYLTNLRIAEEKMQGMRVGDMSGMPDLSNLGPSLGGLDMGSIFSNPALMNMATSLLQQPQVQQMMSNMSSSMMGQGMPSASEQDQGQPEMQSSLNNFLQMGQQLAQQFQQQNPEIVEQLRQSRNQGADPSQANNNNQPPPPPPNEDGSTS